MPHRNGMVSIQKGIRNDLLVSAMVLVGAGSASALFARQSTMGKESATAVIYQSLQHEDNIVRQPEVWVVFGLVRLWAQTTG